MQQKGIPMKKLARRVRRFKGRTMGLDLHTEIVQFSVLDQEGDELANDSCPATAEMLTELVERWTAEGTPLQVCVEASGCFMWAFDLLTELLGRSNVHVAAPSRVRVIADSMEKSDENDAWWLAYLLYEGRLPQAFVAEDDLRELRSVTDERSDLMRRMRSHLRQLGMSFSKSAWSSLEGRARIDELVSRCVSAHGVRGEAIGRLWSRIQAMDEQVAHWRGRVASLSRRFEQVKQLDDVLPGVGPVIAAIVWSELGDPSRYRSAKAYAKATGLTPGYRESAGRRSRRAITRQGSAHVRWALTRAVVSCLRSKKGAKLAVRRWVERQSRRKPKKSAIVAAARKLAEGIWRLFAWGEVFDPAHAFGGIPRADAS